MLHVASCLCWSAASGHAFHSQCCVMWPSSKSRSPLSSASAASLAWQVASNRQPCRGKHHPVTHPERHTGTHEQTNKQTVTHVRRRARTSRTNRRASPSRTEPLPHHVLACPMHLRLPRSKGDARRCARVCVCGCGCTCARPACVRACVSRACGDRGRASVCEKDRRCAARNAKCEKRVVRASSVGATWRVALLRGCLWST